MDLELEYPNDGGEFKPELMYRDQGDDVPRARPLLTGDILSGLHLEGRNGITEERMVIIMQHPCSMRTNGVDLAWRIQAVEVLPHEPIKASMWQRGNFHFMPFPDLLGGNYAADFDLPYLLTPDQIQQAKRVATLSQTGLNLLLQRNVHYASRVVVPTAQLQEVTSAFMEEADLCEEWCEELWDSEDTDTLYNVDETIRHLASEFTTWIRGKDNYGIRRQDRLSDPQARSAVRKEMRKKLRTRKNM